MAQMNRKLIYGGLGIVVVAAWVMTSSEPTAGQKSRSIPRPKAAKAAGFTEEDYSAKFDRLNEPPRDAFMPVVARSGGSAIGPNVVPAEFAGGEVDWVFTGRFVEDGVPRALVENKSSGEWVFLGAGQSWKSCSVQSIGPDSLTLQGRSGRTATLTPVTEYEDLTPSGSGALRPFAPPVSGEIGRGVALRPEPTGNDFSNNNRRMDQDANEEE